MRTLIFILLSCVTAFGQTQVARPLGTTAAKYGYLEYIAAPETLPLIISLHGVGSEGNGREDLYRIASTGMAKLINANKFPDKFVVLSPSGAGTNFNRVSPVVLNTGTNAYEVYALCDPSSNGFYRVGKFTTSDNFATQVTFVGYVSTDNTRKHWNLQPDFNYHFNSHAVLVGTQVDGSNGYEWIYELK